MSFKKGQMIFAEGDTSDAVFVIQIGSVRLSAKSPRGKNATLDILRANDFVGKDALTGQPRRTVSACALTSSQLLRINTHSEGLTSELPVIRPLAVTDGLLAGHLGLRRVFQFSRRITHRHRCAGDDCARCALDMEESKRVSRVRVSPSVSRSLLAPA